MGKNFLKLILITALLIFTGACSKDTPGGMVDVAEANRLLSGDIVLDTKAKMGTVDKTLLPNGCPTKFNFGWDEEKQKLKVALPRFKVGKMLFAVVFEAYATYSEVNYFKRKEYPPEDGWIQFKADNGLVIPEMPEGQEPPMANGAGLVEGFVNPRTQEIEFLINYNMMNVTSHCFRQKIDKKRIKNYETEFKQYEKDLEEYKKEHGIK